MGALVVSIETAHRQPSQPLVMSIVQIDNNAALSTTYDFQVLVLYASILWLSLTVSNDAE